MREIKLSHLGSFQDKDDGTIKSVYRSSRGVVETTLIKNKSDCDVDVYCVPTHHYCNLGCKMCHLTKEGIQKPMVPILVGDFVESVIRTGYEGCDIRGERRTDNHKCLISFMGVGEPLLNLGLLQGAFENESCIREVGDYEDVSYAVSTMMPNSSLRTFGNEVCERGFPAKVHFSMHSGFSDERFNLLPCTKVTNGEALEMLCSYRSLVRGVPEIVNNLKNFHCGDDDPVEIHYTLIKGINDSDRHLEELITLSKEFRVPIKFLRFNPIGELERSLVTENWIDVIGSVMPDLKVREYIPPGHQVGSSCGEFTKHYYHSDLESDDEKREFEEWKLKHQIEEGSK